MIKQILCTSRRDSRGVALRSVVPSVKTMVKGMHYLVRFCNIAARHSTCFAWALEYSSMQVVDNDNFKLNDETVDS